MPIEGLPEVTPQLRRSDPLNDRDVKAKVQAGEELTRFEAAVRHAYAQKKTIGSFLIGLGTFLTATAVFYPFKWLQAASVLSGVAGGLLLGGGAQSLKSDQYEQQKNELLKERGLM
jgi:hypothetical protein